MIVRILADAEAEIDAARRYLNEQSTGLGGRFLEALADTLREVGARPMTDQEILDALHRMIDNDKKWFIQWDVDVVRE